MRFLELLRAGLLARAAGFFGAGDVLLVETRRGAAARGVPSPEALLARVATMVWLPSLTCVFRLLLPLTAGAKQQDVWHSEGSERSDACVAQLLVCSALAVASHKRGAREASDL